MRIKELMHLKGLTEGCLAHNKLSINHSCGGFNFYRYYGRIRKETKVFFTDGQREALFSCVWLHFVIFR